MAFTVEAFHDLVRLLEQHPQWRAQLRRMLLTDQLLDEPGGLGVRRYLLVAWTVTVTWPGWTRSSREASRNSTLTGSPSSP